MHLYSGNSYSSIEDNDSSESDMDNENYQTDYENNNEYDDFEDINDISQSEQFVYDAELTNTYLEEGTLQVNDLAEAEQIADNYSSLSEGAFSYEGTYEINTEAGEIIKDALLAESYSENGYIDAEDMIQAEHQAVIQGIQEESTIQDTYNDDLSEGGEFIQDSLLQEIYLENGTFNEDDVNESTSIAFDSDDIIDDLFDG